jgi:hypothetical protein
MKPPRHPRPVDELRVDEAAMLAAAARARQIAIDTNTAITVWEDGKVRHITADELRAERDASLPPS